MKNSDFLKRLKEWLVCESSIDTYGHISPSKRAIDTTHYYFFLYKTDNPKYIESIKSDNQGGIIVAFTQANTSSKFIIHVLMDGVIDVYETKSNNNTYKERFENKENKKGFGTDSYKFE